MEKQICNWKIQLQKGVKTASKWSTYWYFSFPVCGKTLSHRSAAQQASVTDRLCWTTQSHSVAASVFNLVLKIVVLVSPTHTKTQKSHRSVLAPKRFCSTFYVSLFYFYFFSQHHWAQRQTRRKEWALTGTSTASNRHLLTCWAPLWTKQLHSVHTPLAWANSEENSTHIERGGEIRGSGRKAGHVKHNHTPLSLSLSLCQRQEVGSGAQAASLIDILQHEWEGKRERAVK